MTIPNQTNRRTAEQGDPVILETDRLILRPLTWADRPALCAILQDAQTMTYYNGAFDDVMVDQWLQKQLDRYKTFGIGLWAVIRKSDARLIGQCGLTWQPWKDRDVLEIGYLFNRHFWHQGYAREAAAACRITPLTCFRQKRCVPSSGIRICQVRTSPGPLEWNPPTSGSSAIEEPICPISAL